MKPAFTDTKEQSRNKYSISDRIEECGALHALYETVVVLCRALNVMLLEQFGTLAGVPLHGQTTTASGGAE